MGLRTTVALQLYTYFIIYSSTVGLRTAVALEFNTYFIIYSSTVGLRTALALEFNTYFIIYSSTVGLRTAVAHEFNTYFIIYSSTVGLRTALALQFNTTFSYLLANRLRTADRGSSRFRKGGSTSHMSVSSFIQDESSSHGHMQSTTACFVCLSAYVCRFNIPLHHLDFII